MTPADRARAARRAQGLPEKVEDPAALDRIARTVSAAAASTPPAHLADAAGVVLGSAARPSTPQKAPNARVRNQQQAPA